MQNSITQTRPYLDMYIYTAENQKKKQCILQRQIQLKTMADISLDLMEARM